LKSLIRIIIVSILLVSLITAQEKGTIRGVVKESSTLESLPFGNVFIKELNIGASANNRGYFIIPSIPANKNYTIVVSYVGYKTQQLSILVKPDIITEIEILMVPSNIQFDAIETTEYLNKNKNNLELGKTIITPKELETLPKGVETDLLRSLASLPGVQSTGDVSVKFNVRGGESNQNLIIMDGIPVYYPFHAIGLFSVIDPDVINNVEFFRGGFPANYGRAISSILKIITKDGDKNKFGTKLSASLLSAKGLVEGPIPYGSFFISGRKSLSNNILRKFVNNNDLPVDFYDASFKINYSNPIFFSGSKFSLHGLFSEDNLKYPEENRPDYKWRNNNWGLKVFTMGEIPFFLDFGISISNYKNEIIQKLSTVKPKLNEVNDFTISADFLYVLDSKDEAGIGVDVKSVSTSLFLINRLDFRADVGDDGLGSNAYVNYKFMQFPDLGIDLGARFNLKDIAAKGDFIEPRINISYTLFPELTLKAAFGIYQQELTTIVDEREVLSLFDPVIIVPDYLRKTKSLQYVFGITSKLSSNFSIDVESYYKKIVSSPTLNENKILFTEPDLLQSSGESYGGEVQTKFNSNLIDVALSYALSWSFKEVNGVRYSPRYDSRHNLNFLLTFNLPYDWKFSTNWAYHSGFPFTQQLGYYDKLSLNNFLNDYNIYESLFPITFFGDKNTARLPDYHRLDFILSKKINLSFLKMNLDVSAINVYNRKNVFYFDQSTGKIVNMLPFLLTASVKVEL